MQVFTPLERVIVKRNDGTFESWVVIHPNHEGRVLVGAEVPHPYGTAEGTKQIPVATLERWQTKYADCEVIVRPASPMMLEAACLLAEGRLR
jgi:hypothetical protein